MFRVITIILLVIVTFLVRKRALAFKLQLALRRQRGQILSESKHTLSFLPAGKVNLRLVSKHDVTHAHQLTDKHPPPREQNTRREATNWSEANVIDQQTSSVQEQIAAQEPVSPEEKARKRPKKRFVHAEVPVQPGRPNSNSPHMMQHDHGSIDEEPEPVANQLTNSVKTSPVKPDLDANETLGEPLLYKQ